MILSLIAAIGKNNELGKDNTLLWQMPADMKHFRETTSGHPVIMGRKTFESIGKPLPNRRNIVITRDNTYISHGVDVAHSLEEALELLRTSPQPSPYQGEGEEEIFIIGGAEIYKQSIELADNLYITKIDAEDNTADAFFPVIGPEWKIISEEKHSADEKNPIAYSFLTYQK